MVNRVSIYKVNKKSSTFFIDLHCSDLILKSFLIKMRKLLILYILILSVSCSGSTRFRLLAPGSTGIGFENRITETDSLNAANYEYIYNGTGVVVADLNNDDLPDIIFAWNQVSPRIYLNQGKFRFRDITGNFSGISDSL
jgi:enediyne biosynthesis protein E4